MRHAPFSFGTDSDNGAFVTGYSVRLESEQESMRLWLVDVTYSSRPRQKCDDGNPDDPLEENPVITGDAIRYTESVTEDRDGVAIRNSYGDYIEGAERDAHRPVLRIQKNQAEISLLTFQEYTDTLNKDEFFEHGARGWKMLAPRWTQQHRGSCDPFYQVVYEFELTSSPHGWQPRYVDRGWRYYDKKNRQSKNFTDDLGSPLNAQGLLDGAGDRLTFHADPELTGNFNFYVEKDFSTLNIPTSF